MIMFNSTTNVLCFDFLRLITKNFLIVESFGKYMSQIFFNSIIVDGKFFNENSTKESYSKLINSYNILYADINKLASSNVKFQNN